MHGDATLGALLRDLRTWRGLTLAAVARRVGCAQSLLSQVETGARVLQPWLARAIDAVYETGGAIAALSAADSTFLRTVGRDARHHLSVPEEDLILVRVPPIGVTVPVSRRALLSALALGAAGGSLLPDLERAAATLIPDEQLLGMLAQTLHTLQAASRRTRPARLIGPLTDLVAVTEIVRRRAHRTLQRDFTIVQTRCAESLSWMAEETGDLASALYWTDRTQQWARLAGWQSMIAYTHVRRSMLAISFASNGPGAVEHAARALRAAGTSARIRGLAAKQLAYGYALAGRPEAVKIALEQTCQLFGVVDRDSEPDGHAVGQRSIDSPDLLTIYQATCEVYLGGGERTIATVAPRLDDIGRRSRRTHAITTAKLAQAYAHAGEPGHACDLILHTLDAAAAVDSQTTRSELQRALPTLARWPRRDDVCEVRHRLANLG